MKTLRDLEEMKNKPNIQFGNQYDFFFMNSENDYIKSHESRINEALKDWDTEAREFIVSELINILKNNGMKLNRDDINEFIELIEK